MAKNQEMDNLAKDAARALAAGMSYGKWKPLFPHTKDDNILVPAPNTKPCKFCGKPMKKGGRHRDYCSEECAYEARLLRFREYGQRRPKKQKNKEEA